MRKKLTKISLAILLVSLALFFAINLYAKAPFEEKAQNKEEKHINIISINGAINPPIAGFINESIEKSEKDDSSALIILLDTPGGLDTSMREIVKSIMDSNVPVIVYVYPSGARAASAGSIILLSAHIAAMAPGTNVGAAHPVSIGKEKVDKEMMSKVVKDAEAYAKSIAMKRGRNVEWAAKAVRESASITAKDALEKRVIDIVAEDIDRLIEGIEGKEVETKKGKVILRLKGKKKVQYEMPFKYRFLSYISDPNVAYILMMIGLYGILFEIYSPGAIFPGVIGGISIILALYAFSTIPISYAGIFLILLGIVFFILELKIVSHGVLGLAGIISLVIGSIMLIDLPYTALSISWKSILTVVILTGIFFFGVLSYAIKAQLSKVKTGSEGLVGEEGEAKTDVNDDNGKVFVHGELWNARSKEQIKKGEKVIVEKVDGLILVVKKKGG
ncbi:MAG TPA: nodulation protein NfeD [Syntrophorhabdaceae bacterium]|nr:nodulation protein NfeD [Syntrophorhabdaceae bacterium]HPU30342.1 nodulation protein NfeD [Syntrophorhabdaceae bacterium]